MSDEILAPGSEPAHGNRALATVLFTDIVGATKKVATIGDQRWRDVLRRHNSMVRRDLGRFRGREVDTAGDGFFAVFEEPAWAIRCAHAIMDSVEQLGIQIRVGIHTGECELIDEKVGGLAVHIGARVVEQAGAGEILVTGTLRDLVAGSGFRFDDRGSQMLRGVPGEWRLHAVDRGSVTMPIRSRAEGYIETFVGSLAGAAVLGAVGAGVGIALSHPWTDASEADLRLVFAGPAIKIGLVAGAMGGCAAALMLRGLGSVRETVLLLAAFTGSLLEGLDLKTWDRVWVTSVIVGGSAPPSRFVAVHLARRLRPRFRDARFVETLRRARGPVMGLSLVVALAIGAFGTRALILDEGVTALGLERAPLTGDHLWFLSLPATPPAIISTGPIVDDRADASVLPGGAPLNNEIVWGGRTGRRWVLTAHLDADRGLCLSMRDAARFSSVNGFCGPGVPERTPIGYGITTLPGRSGPRYLIGVVSKKVARVRIEGSAFRSREIVPSPAARVEYPFEVESHKGRGLALGPLILIPRRSEARPDDSSPHIDRFPSRYEREELYPVNYFLIQLPRGATPSALIALDQRFAELGRLPLAPCPRGGCTSGTAVSES